MIARTYGRRNRGGLARTYSDSFEYDDDDDVVSDPFSLSQENPSQDFYSANNNNFRFSSSQDSSWSSFDPTDPFSFNPSQDTSFLPPPPLPPPSKGGVSRKSKKPRNSKLVKDSAELLPPVNSTTLMEAQEFGEMMEFVDEVNFALDGLRRPGPVRIRRASLLSLLSICGSVQQRRLVRAEGMVKTIIEAILHIRLDDSPSNLAAAALFYVLIVDGLDDQLLELPNSIRFLIKLLKPINSTAAEKKTPNIGIRLLAVRKDSDILRVTSRPDDSNSDAIVTKVQEILVSCKDLKSESAANSGEERPELNPKWIALLTLEKACLTKLSFDEMSGTVRKTSSNFKEKFREFGGLDAVFEVALNCYSVLQGWSEGSLSSQKTNDDLRKSLVLLLKCLKIMENATFRSKDNQNHLLGMRGNLDSHGFRLSFTKLITSVIKILSGLYLLQNSANANVGKTYSLSDGSDPTSDLALVTDFKDNNEVIDISSTSYCSAEGTSYGKSFDAPQMCQLSQFASTSDPSATFPQDRIHSSTSSSCSESLRSSRMGSRINVGLLGKPNFAKDSRCELLVDSQDPFAFDEDDDEPSKWDMLSGKKKKSRTRNGGIISKAFEDGFLSQLMSQEESRYDKNSPTKSSDGEHHTVQKNDIPKVSDGEHFSLLADCLLTAVKVLMNLSNDNPPGCRQIATCGGLDILCSLIVDHFPSFSSSLSLIGEMKEDASSIELDRQNGSALTDQELDFLVAILCLLVNLVEKDEQNRSRLAAATVSLPSSEVLVDGSRKDLIPLLCSIFLANQGADDASGGDIESWNDEAALLQGEKEAEKMIVEAYAALLLAFLSTESKSTLDSIANCLPNHNLAILVPVLERFLAFHLTLDMISPETHKAVSEVIESCRIP